MNVPLTQTTVQMDHQDRAQIPLEVIYVPVNQGTQEMGRPVLVGLLFLHRDRTRDFFIILVG